MTTVIVNDTKHGLTMKVGSRNCYVKLASFKVGSEYRLEVDYNWTYQEFLLEDKCNAANRLYLSSDDCFDCERITIREMPDGKLAMYTLLRSQLRRKQPCGFPIDNDTKKLKAKIRLKPVRVKADVVRDVRQGSIECGNSFDSFHLRARLPLQSGQASIQQALVMEGTFRSLKVRDGDKGEWARVEVTSLQWNVSPDMVTGEVSYVQPSLTTALIVFSHRY